MFIELGIIIDSLFFVLFKKKRGLLSIDVGILVLGFKLWMVNKDFLIKSVCLGMRNWKKDNFEDIYIKLLIVIKCYVLFI